jgi:uncharacterized membrane protein
MNNNKKITKVISNNPLEVGIIFIGVLVLICFIHFRKYDISQHFTEWGQFGDFMGGILNPIFGLISLVIISETLTSQVKASKKQEFESHFFALLNLYNSILGSIEILDETKTIKGRYCFYLFHNERIIDVAKKERITIESAYMKFFQEEGWRIEHYYRTVYHLFKHVKDGHEFDDAEKKKYYDLIKSQLSEYELVLLWLNCQSPHKGNWDSLINDLHSNPFEHLNKCRLKENYNENQMPSS